VLDERHAGRRLDDVTREWMRTVLGTPPARAAIRRMIMGGGVRVGSRPLRAPSQVVVAGARLEASVRPGRLRRDDGPREFDPAWILFEDEVLVAVDKPPGLPTVATADLRRPHLAGLVERFLASRAGDGRLRPIAVGVHQRLDVDTSGVVLFVKDPAGNAAVAEQFQSRSVEKTYLALTGRPRDLPPERWRADSDVGAESRGRTTTEGRPAITDFVVREVAAGGLLVEARPRTGRKHQVRIHLAAAGLPILGDARYGDGRAAPRVMLHAARLALRHPISGAALAIVSRPPRDFRDVLDRIRRVGASGPGGIRRGPGDRPRGR
jgi:23S rRNA pseudouridine1911/1915/1917 synthase